MTSMFKQRHFNALATMMQDAHPGTGLSKDNRAVMQWQYIRTRMADLFKRDNHNFMYDRFIGACEPGANVRAKSHKPAA